MDNDLKLCYDALEAKNAEHTRRWRYYDGDHPIAFVNPKLSQVIPNSVVFKKNFCQVVINVTRDRLQVQTWNHKQETETKAMADLWRKRLAKIQASIHVATLTTGESYAIAWPDRDGKPKAYYHDPRMVHAVYENDEPDVMRVAAKQWESNKKHYLNLYYPDRIEHYTAENKPNASTAFTLQSEEGNPYGIIPVFHFRLNERVNTGELTTGVISLQDAMNKLLNDLMVSSEYSSFPQRWGIGHFDPGTVPVGPATMLKLPPSEQGEQPTQLGAFPTTDPANFLTPIDSLAHAMAILSATPKHYLTGQGGDPSGEALQAMESPLVAKVLGYQDVLQHPWAALMNFFLMLDGFSVPAEDIECIWMDPHTVQPQSQAETRLTNTQAGIPLVNILRDEGWTEEQLDQLAEDQQAQAAQLPQPGAPQVRTNNPVTPEQAAPRFDGIVRTPDIAGALAGSGALSRAVNRAANRG